MNDYEPERLTHLLEQLSVIEPPPGAIDRALERTRKALGDVSTDRDLVESRGPRRSVLRPSRWAAAAAILMMLTLTLIAALIFPNFGSESAFAKVQLALKDVPSIAYRMEVLEAAPGIDTKTTKTIVDFSRQRIRRETVDGDDVLIQDMKTGTMTQLFRRQKVAILTTGMKQEDLPSDIGGFVEKLRNADPRTVQHLADGELDGRQVNRYRISPDSPLAHGVESLFLVDPRTQLPVRVESVVKYKDGRLRVRLACTDFSFGECDASLFELKPPDDYRVQRVRANRPESPAPEPVAVAPLAGRNAPVAFELRLAESTAGDGLTEALVGKTDQKVYLHSKPVITRLDIQEVRLLKDESSGYLIELTFTAEGAERLSEATTKNRNKLLAVLIGGRVVFAPRILATISNSARIMGNFTAGEASDIVRGLSAPAK
jgi:outer membrane lipoprotein-sorting protein